ncbi:MAG: ParA family protein [Candidatus Kerfeldbacteria bacterium]|nr:ParA family protein [Candidatus Kerfeldbacteria bacterium]
MTRILSIVNQKGGVGKTTTAVNLAAYLARAGKSVLLIDIDPQGNASLGVGVDYRTVQQGVYEALLHAVGLEDVIQKTKTTTPDLLHVAPATTGLAGANIELVGMENREFRLQHEIERIRSGYDIIIIDNPPSLGLLTVNGLVAATEVLIPIQADYYALEGLGQLLDTIHLVQNNLKPDIRILGVLLTMVDSRTKLTRDVLREVREHFPRKVMETVIPRNVRLAEAPSHGMTIDQYDPASRGAQAYEQLAQEVLVRAQVPQENLWERVGV